MERPGGARVGVSCATPTAADAPSPSMVPPISDKYSCGILLALALWLVIFMTRPHKEERFLFPVYPLVCFAVTYGIERVEVSEWVVEGCFAHHCHVRSSLLPCKGRTSLLEWA